MISTPSLAWQHPASFPALAGEAHIWLADLNRPDLTATAHAMLSPAEIERGLRYRFERDQTWFFARHVFLRTLLSRYLHHPPSTFNLQPSTNGKPYLENHPLHFNISDSGGWCLLAFTTVAPLGVDLEEVRERGGDLMSVARRYFSPAELVELAQVPDKKKLDGFYHVWTQKEAFIKATGEGLARALDSFDVVADPSQPGTVRAARGDRPEGWAMRTFVPREGFRGAVCIAGGESVNLRTFRLEN